MINIILLLVYSTQVAWKRLYSKSSGDHGTLSFFRTILHRKTVNSDVKKAVDANIDFLNTVFKGHVLASACGILGITNLDDDAELPQGIQQASAKRKWGYVRSLAKQVVDKCSLMDITSDVQHDTQDGVYNYARVLCHYASLVLEFRDAWGEGDGERIFRCWRILLVHFKSSGRTKYSLEALRLQLQAKAILSPMLSHQLIWDRFVNKKGGAGNNIPNDLYNEHVVKQVKRIVRCMGPNLTEKALQRASRSVSSIHAICKQYDKHSGVPLRTTAHSTLSDASDVSIVTQAVLKNELLHIIPGRHHKAFKIIKLNPVWNFNKKTTLEWIEKKKKQFQKSNTVFAEDDEVEDVNDEVEDANDEVEDANDEDEYDLNGYSDDDECIEEMLAEYDEDEYMLL